MKNLIAPSVLFFFVTSCVAQIEYDVEFVTSVCSKCISEGCQYCSGSSWVSSVLSDGFWCQCPGDSNEFSSSETTCYSTSDDCIAAEEAQSDSAGGWGFAVWVLLLPFFCFCSCVGLGMCACIYCCCKPERDGPGVIQQQPQQATATPTPASGNVVYTNSQPVPSAPVAASAPPLPPPVMAEAVVLGGPVNDENTPVVQIKPDQVMR